MLHLLTPEKCPFLVFWISKRQRGTFPLSRMYSQQVIQWMWPFLMWAHYVIGSNPAKSYHSASLKICSKKLLFSGKLIVKNRDTTLSKFLLAQVFWTCKLSSSLPVTTRFHLTLQSFPPSFVKSSQAHVPSTKPFTLFAEPYKNSKYHLKMFKVSALPRSFQRAWTYKHTTEPYSKDVNNCVSQKRTGLNLIWKQLKSILGDNQSTLVVQVKSKGHFQTNVIPLLMLPC